MAKVPSPSGNFEKIVVPDKKYAAVFTGYKTFEIASQYKPGEQSTMAALTFQIKGKGGQEADIEGVAGYSFGGPEKPSKLREWMAALQGKSVKNTDLIDDLDELIGRKCEILTYTRNKGTDDACSKVDKVLPVYEDEGQEELPF